MIPMSELMDLTSLALFLMSLSMVLSCRSNLLLTALMMFSSAVVARVFNF